MIAVTIVVIVFTIIKGANQTLAYGDLLYEIRYPVRKTRFNDANTIVATGQTKVRTPRENKNKVITSR